MCPSQQDQLQSRKQMGRKKFSYARVRVCARNGLSARSPALSAGSRPTCPNYTGAATPHCQAVSKPVSDLAAPSPTDKPPGPRSSSTKPRRALRDFLPASVAVVPGAHTGRSGKSSPSFEQSFQEVFPDAAKVVPGFCTGFGDHRFEKSSGNLRCPF
jgi:hypothetical protein